MDIGKSFSYVFEDEEWVPKVLIGALLLLASIIPVVNIFTALVVAGYAIRTMKNVSEGMEHPLPAWDDWGGDWVKGALTTVASVIYALPAMLLSAVNAGISAFATRGGQDLSGGPLACFLGLQCLVIFWSLLVAVWMPAAMVRFSRQGTFAAFFDMAAIWAFIRENIGDYVVALVLVVLAKIISMFGLILCVIGVFATGLWASLVMSHLFGQIGARPAAAVATVEGSAPSAPVTYGELTEAPPSTVEEPKDPA
jgi:hypothetical protein